MSSQVLACSLGQFSEPKNCPLASYHPNVWGDWFIYLEVVFLNFLFKKITWLSQVTLAGKVKHLEDLKEEIRRKLMNVANECRW